MSDFKSKIDWPKTPENLPTYKGEPPGKADVRTSGSKAGGMQGIRRVDWTDAQGNSYTLNTRNGFPEVVTTPKKVASTEELTVAHGWLAHISSAPVSAMFSPYSLAVINPSFTPAKDCYSILPFTTTFNVPQPDHIKWGDTISFSASGLLVNGKAMPLLGISGGIPTQKAIPWLIPASGSDIAKYGDGTVKRVFSVSRVDVYSWAAGGVSEVLQGETFRSDNKALVCGQRIDATNQKAWLSQLVFTGDLWNSMMGGWGFNTAEIAMLLTPPYLTKIDGGPVVDQGTCGVDGGSPESGVNLTDRVNPPTEWALMAVPGPISAGDTSASIDWIWTEKILHAFTGQVRDDYTGTQYSGAYSSSGEVAGRPYLVSASNTKRYRTHSETLLSKNHVMKLPPYDNQPLGDELNHTGGSVSPTFYWQGTIPLGPRGLYLPVDVNAGGCAGTAGYATEDQDGASTIEVDSIVLVQVSFGRHKASGNTVTAIPTTTDLDSYLGTDAYDAYTGFGAWGFIDTSTDGATLGIQYGPPDHTAEMAALHLARAGEFASCLEYDTPLIYGGHSFYTGSVGGRTETDDQSLTWATKDFILYDKPNGCFISIEATFNGEQHYGGIGAATLDVNFKIKTPAGEVTQLLFHSDPTYSVLLPEKEVQPGVFVIPSPRQRLIFTPLFQEQGDFKGGAYTTQSEIDNGATPAYLFNFVLKLDTYSAISDDTSTDTTIHFIPCNLIEMLYAYVFSTKAGVDDYQRYPVEFVTRYNNFVAGIFSPQFQVFYRDGTATDWTTSFGDAHLTEQTQELYRV